jgi:hypothetical protein
MIQDIITLFLLGWVVSSVATTIGVKYKLNPLLKLICQKCITLWLSLLISIFYFTIEDAFLISASAAFLAYIQNTIEDLI